MPRYVDADLRQQRIAAAVWTVIRRFGLPGATVRAVAEEAGLSAGALRRTFDSQAALRLFAFETIGARSMERLAAVDQNLPVRERVERGIWALMPVTEDQVAEEQVRIAFLIESRTDPRIAAVISEERARTLALTRRALTALRDAADAPPAGAPFSPDGVRPSPEEDLEAGVVEFLALLDGLAQQAALNPAGMPPERVKRTIARWLDRW